MVGVTGTVLKSPGADALSLFNQRAGTVLEGTKRLVAWNDGAKLVVVPFTFRFRRLLDFVAIHVVHHAAIFEDAPVLGEEIGDRHLTHLGHHGFARIRTC